MPAHGVLVLGPFEIARLDNDPNLPEHGRLTLRMSEVDDEPDHEEAVRLLRRRGEAGTGQGVGELRIQPPRPARR